MPDLQEKALAVIRGTRDGNDLAPEHLKLVELVVNGRAQDDMLAALDRLYEDVVADRYRPPWFHGLEHLTRDLDGYVYWKGQEVEHYAAYYAHSEKGARKARVLAQRCRYLEAVGAPINSEVTVWRWQESYLQNCLDNLGCEWVSCAEMGYQALIQPAPPLVFGRLFFDPDPRGFFQAQIAKDPNTLDHVDGPHTDYHVKGDFPEFDMACEAVRSLAEEILANTDHKTPRR